MKIAVVAPAGWTTDVLCGMVQGIAPSATMQVFSDCRERKLRDLAPDLVLCAVGAPAVAGRTIAELARAHPAARIAALGPPANDRQIQSLFREGARDYLSSSLAETVLRGTLRWIVDSVSRTAPRDPPHAPAADASEIAGEIEKVASEFGLTKKRAEVLTHICRGETNSEIAKLLDITEGTVKLHVTAIFKAMKVRNRVEAAQRATPSRSIIFEQIRRAQGGKPDLKWLLEYMSHQHLAQGTVVFRLGDVAGDLFYLQRGTIRLEEIGVDMQQGDMFGEIGVFSPENKRTCSATCATATDVFKLRADEAKRLYFLNPSFGYHVVHLISSRLMADRARVT